MAQPSPTGLAIIGCGYVADSYRNCLSLHHGALELVGVYDRDPERLKAFAATWGDHTYSSPDAVLTDPKVSLIVNLTTPESHFEVSSAAIAAGKHVYSEKPLAVSGSDAILLRDAAQRRGVRIASAPCNLLGETAQTLWKAVREKAVGDVRLIYAELDDGMVHRSAWRQWVSKSGRRWPAEGEFETGCTYEHAGYVVTLLAAMFGPVERVTAFSGLIIPDKKTDVPLPHVAPDFSVGCLEFHGGVVARLTNSIVAPYDHRLRLIGEDGVLEVKEPWDYACKVRLNRISSGRLSRYLERSFGPLPGKALPPVRPCPLPRGRGRPTMDFMRGVRELADSLTESRPCRLDPDFAIHVTEVTEILQFPERFGRPARVQSRFAPIRPMEWAQ